MVWIYAAGPVVLAAESDPVKAAGEDLSRREGLVNGRVLGEEARWGGVGGEGEE